MNESRNNLARCMAFGLVLAALAIPAYATPPDDALLPAGEFRSTPLTAEVFAPDIPVSSASPVRLALILRIDEGWHINAHDLDPSKGIPTTLVLAEGPATVDVRFPPGHEVELSFSDVPLSVYDGNVQVGMDLRFRADVPPGPTTVTFRLRFQACDDQTCLLPVTLAIPLDLELARPRAGTDGESGGSVPTVPPAAKPSGDAPPAANQIPPASLADDQSIAARLAAHGDLVAFLLCFLGGLGLTLTPCVYPMIPITVGYFGGQAGGSWGRQLSMAAVFGLGLAITFAAIGAATALAGGLLGALLQSQAVLVGIAAVCVAMGLNAFGLWELRLPGWLLDAAGSSGSGGYAGAAFMGLTMGVVAAPCIGAFVAGLMSYVGQRGDVVFGGLTFFSMGLGLAAPFVVLGTSSGLVSRLPRSGGWMVYVKKLMGGLLFAAAAYFVRPLIAPDVFRILVAGGLAVGGLYYGWFESTRARLSRGFQAFRFLVGFLLLLGSVGSWSFLASPGEGGAKIPWRPYSEQALAEAAASGRPVVIDFFADWCIPCHELDRYTFSEARVAAASAGFLMVRADLTKSDSPESMALVDRYAVQGMPTVVFLDSAGKERRELRAIGFIPADDMLKRMKAVVP